MRTVKHPVVERIEGEVSGALRGLGYELVLAKFGGPRSHPTLTLYIDKPGGVTVADCQQATERLSVLLDILDPVPTSYNLLVSSPGLDRPLTRDDDFVRFAGQPVAVSHRDGEDRRVTTRGKLEGVEGEVALVRVGEKVERIPLGSIEQAHLVYEWEEDQ